MKTHTLALFLTSVISNCIGATAAHAAARQPPVFGFTAIQCQPVREVFCIANTPHCKERMAAAVNAINTAVGRDLLVFQGELAQDSNVWPGNAIVAMKDNTGDPNRLGYTWAKTGDTPCIQRALIVFSDELEHAYAYAAQAVYLHELIHALGASHAASVGAYMSIMTPSINDPVHDEGLTVGDIATLRAVYGPMRK